LVRKSFSSFSHERLAYDQIVRLGKEDEREGGRKTRRGTYLVVEAPITGPSQRESQVGGFEPIFTLTYLLS
jgi:hypothetical protein